MLCTHADGRLVGNRYNRNVVTAGEKKINHCYTCSHVGKLKFVIHCCYRRLRMHHVECAYHVRVMSLNVVPPVLSHVNLRTHDSGPQRML